MVRRRYREEWERILAERERLGESYDETAKRHGVRPDTVKWWSWRVGRSRREEGALVCGLRTSGFVEVASEPVDDRSVAEGPGLVCVRVGGVRVESASFPPVSWLVALARSSEAWPC